MFGLSFGEVILLALIAMIVVGPRNLPTMLRTLGKTVAKLKRLTVDIREQTGIDEILKGEGIEKEMEQLRMIASGRILDVDLASDPADDHPPRYREYPRMGVDAYDAIPEDTAPYVPMETANAAPDDTANAATTETASAATTESPSAATTETASAEASVSAAATAATAVVASAAIPDQAAPAPDAPVGRGRARANVASDPFDKPVIDPETKDEPVPSPAASTEAGAANVAGAEKPS